MSHSKRSEKKIDEEKLFICFSNDNTKRTESDILYILCSLCAMHA